MLSNWLVATDYIQTFRSMSSTKAILRLARIPLMALCGLWYCGNAFANQAATVATGSSVTISVTANGTAPFTYQWNKNSFAISGATAASYAISSAQFSDAGSYTVVVSNSAGSTTSDVATLTVFHPRFSRLFLLRRRLRPYW